MGRNETTGQYIDWGGGMTVFKGGKRRDDQFVGDMAADRFIFDPLELTSGDVIVGGEGRAIEVLKLRVPGAVSASSLANVSGIERFELADGVNSLVLTDKLAVSANGGWLAIGRGRRGPDRRRRW